MTRQQRIDWACALLGVLAILVFFGSLPYMVQP